MCHGTRRHAPRRPTEAQNREANAAMLRNVLEAIGKQVQALDPPYTEDMPRLDCPNFYYDQEDILAGAVSSSLRGGGGAVTWSVHRPNINFGFSPRGAINIVCSLCVYAAVCRKEGAPLRWPGSRGGWEGFISASDADLVAEHHVWAAVDPAARNEAFNCSNGDVCTWKKLWPVLAGRFGVEWVGYEGEEKRFELAEAMAGGKAEALWAEIVEENGLVKTHVSEVASWWAIDVTVDQHGLDSVIIDSMNKSKEHGFLGFRNTFKSFNTCIDRLKAHKIVP